jgi:cytochrome c oxidase subunit II
MKTFYRKYRIIFLLVVVAGCVGSQLFQAVPSDVDRGSAPKQTIEVTAKDYEFNPETITVKEGTLLTLKVKSIEGTHGFQVAAFGINEQLKEGNTVVIELYAAKKGEYAIKCSHFCGLGHFGMHGKLVVE